MAVRRVLITGSGGCLGRPLARRLATEGRLVVGLDIRRDGDTGGFEEVVGDVGDMPMLRDLFARHRFDAVVHCGGISGQMVAADDPHRVCLVNVLGTVNLLEAARVARAERFIYCSSQGAYGVAASPTLTEDAPFQPLTVYGATKAAADVIVRAYRLQHGLDATSIRIGRVYGPGRRTDSLITTMLEAALAGRLLRLPASRGRRLQYVYEDDVVAGLHLALDRQGLPQPSYNLSGPGRHTDEEIAASIRALLPAAKIGFDDAPLKDGTFFSAELDCSSAARDFDYRPRYDLARGLAAFIHHLRSR